MPDETIIQQGPAVPDDVLIKRLRARIRELETLDDQACAKIDAINAENTRLRAGLDA